MCGAAAAGRPTTRRPCDSAQSADLAPHSSSRAERGAEMDERHSKEAHREETGMGAGRYTRQRNRNTLSPHSPPPRPFSHLIRRSLTGAHTADRVSM